MAVQRVVIALCVWGLVALPKPLQDREWVNPTYSYSEEDLDLLARLIYQEAGAEYCTDQMQLFTGSVVLNRVESEWFPNTIHEVIYQPGQYACVDSGAINIPADERSIESARYLLENGTVIPNNVVFQSEGLQGDGLFAQIGNQYYCYKGESWE